MKLQSLLCPVLLAALIVPACGGDDDKCKGVACGANASCESDTGACVCDPGYSGESCATCANGYHAQADACVADECAQDSDCDDGLVCSGNETCLGGICQPDIGIDCPAHASCQEPDGTCACDPGYLPEGEGCVAYLAILGAWVDDWGFSHEVTREAWSTDDSVFHITLTDAEAGFVVAQNAAANPWNAGLWSKFEWGYGGDVLYYCQIAYSAASQDEAAAMVANRASLSTGCGGFSWSRLRPRLEIIGAWMDQWGFAHDITQDTWTTGDSVFHVTRADNPAGFLVAHNDPHNPWSPDLWSRFDWTWDAEDNLYYCQIAYDAADEASAAGNTGADRGDLDHGCAGFGWSALTPN